MDDSYDPPQRFETAIDELHDLVAREVGTTDFGDADYLPGLRVLLQSMDYDPHFTETGRRYAWGTVVGVLKGRAHAIKSMAGHAGFDRRPIVSPIVITGVPRTGTTALHKIMAIDERFQGLETWLLDAPMPRPPMARWADYPQFHKTVAVLENRYRAAPGKRAAHNMVAEEVDECCLVMRQTFISNLWNCGWTAPSYDAWWQCQSELPAYHHHRRCLQLIGMHEPEKRWLLKNPGHLANLDLLFAVYPDAKVIRTHRDPAKAIPSLCSLLMKLHPMMEDQSRYALRARIMLARETAKWADAVRKSDRVQESHAEQIFDLRHTAFHRDPLGAIAQIYEFVGMDLPQTTCSKMARRAEEKPELAMGVHRYDIAEFGMTENQVRDAFSDYVARFALNEPAKEGALS